MNLVHPNLVDTPQVTRIFKASLLTLPYWLAFSFKNECVTCLPNLQWSILRFDFLWFLWQCKSRLQIGDQKQTFLVNNSNNSCKKPTLVKQVNVSCLRNGTTNNSWSILCIVYSKHCFAPTDFPIFFKHYSCKKQTLAMRSNVC